MKTLKDLYARRNEIGEEILKTEKGSDARKRLINERSVIKKKIALAKTNPIFSTVAERDFEFEYPISTATYEPLNAINLDSIHLPHTKPRVFDYDIEHLAIVVREDNLQNIYEYLKTVRGIPVYLRTYTPIPIYLIHEIAYSPFCCVIYNANVIDHNEIRNELSVITACAMAAQIRMFCDTKQDLARALYLLQATACINRFPWKLILSPALKDYAPYLERLSYFYRCEIETKIQGENLNES